MIGYFGKLLHELFRMQEYLLIEKQLSQWDIRQLYPSTLVVIAVLRFTS